MKHLFKGYREPAVLAYHLGNLTVLAQKTVGAGTHLPLPFIEGASGSGIPPQKAGGFSKPLDKGDMQYVDFKVQASSD